MVKLNERKIRWIIQQKLGGRGTGEVALIQRASRRRIEQLWQTYRRTGILLNAILPIVMVAQQLCRLSSS